MNSIRPVVSARLSTLNVRLLKKDMTRFTYTCAAQHARRKADLVEFVASLR